jgi:hypothetical protein
MNYSKLSRLGALGIATNIKTAVHNIDRNAMMQIHLKYGGIGNITRVLVAGGLLTKSQRYAALRTMPKINNPSLVVPVPRVTAG